MVESTIDKIKDITVERQIRKLAGVIDEQNKKIEQSVDFSTDIENLKTSDANQNTEINKLKTTSATHTTDIDNLKASDVNQNTQINNLKQSIATDKLATESAITALQSKDAEQDGTLTNHATLIQGITESLVSDVQIMSGTTTGDIKVRIGRESAAAIDSNDYNLGLPVSAEIIQGTGPSMFKIQITMSTGIKVVSNDFVFTTEAIGNDVYISSFTFKAGNQTGYLSADIGLNNGMTIEANNFLVPTDPNVTSAIADLQTRLTTVENAGVTDISALKTTVSEHTSEINTLKSDVAGLTTDKADVNNNEQTITAGTINATNINKNGVAVATVNDIPSVPDISGKADLNNTKQTIVAKTIFATNLNGVNIKKGNADVATVNDIPNISGKVDKAQGVSNAGKVLGIGSDGNVTPVTVSSGGENWEEVDLSNFPNNWVSGERIKVAFKCYYASSSSNTTIETRTGPTTPLIEFIIPPSFTGMNTILYSSAPDEYLRINNVGGPNEFNGGGMGYVFWLEAYNTSGSSTSVAEVRIDTSKLSTYIYKMYRLKK